MRSSLRNSFEEKRAVPPHKATARFALSCTVAILCGCASYQSKISGPRGLLRSGQIDAAVTKFGEMAEKTGDDQLVYLLEYGTSLQIAGRYAESNAIFLKADKLAELNDFHSVTNVTASALGSETMIQYKGESYEKVLINAMLAINYLMLGQHDDALVETRRLNEKLTAMRLDGRKPYELNPFAKYLSAVIWESDQKYDDAYISYNEAYQLDPTIPFIGADLIRTAKLSRRDDDYKSWKTRFPGVREEASWYDRSLGELVVIFQQGWGPEKKPRSGSPRFPMLVPVYSQTQNLEVNVTNSANVAVGSYRTSQVYNVSQVAIKTLQDDYGALVARRVGGVVAKAVVADQIRQKNALLGEVAWIAMNVSDQADLRQWSTLPATIQMARIRLPPGEYKINLIGMNYGSNTTGEQKELTVKIAPLRKAFINFRSLK